MFAMMFNLLGFQLELCDWWEREGGPFDQKLCLLAENNGFENNDNGHDYDDYNDYNYYNDYIDYNDYNDNDN